MCTNARSAEFLIRSAAEARELRKKSNGIDTRARARLRSEPRRLENLRYRCGHESGRLV